MIAVVPFEKADWPVVWEMMEPVFRAGDTYVYPPDMTEEEAYHTWIVAPSSVFVAKDENGAVFGTYFLKANQPGLGSHVANCGYIVAEQARGKGIATLMCEHSQEEAVRQGFHAMQFNFVVSTNRTAVSLWQKLGFSIAGTLPDAFRHTTLGYVDVYIMYKRLRAKNNASQIPDEPKRELHHP